MQFENESNRTKKIAIILDTIFTQNDANPTKVEANFDTKKLKTESPNQNLNQLELVPSKNDITNKTKNSKTKEQLLDKTESCFSSQNLSIKMTAANKLILWLSSFFDKKPKKLALSEILDNGISQQKILNIALSFKVIGLTAQLEPIVKIYNEMRKRKKRFLKFLLWFFKHKYLVFGFSGFQNLNTKIQNSKK